DKSIEVTLYKNLGWAYFQQNCLEQAKQNLLICLKLESNYTPAYCLLAQVQAAEGDHQSSRESWQNFLEFYSHDQQEKKFRGQLPELEIWRLEALRMINYQQE
ncbi:MAG: LuxR family transcriptional regulator, partial [Dolichospermum sp.]